MAIFIINFKVYSVLWKLTSSPVRVLSKSHCNIFCRHPPDSPENFTWNFAFWLAKKYFRNFSFWNFWPWTWVIVFWVASTEGFSKVRSAKRYFLSGFGAFWVKFQFIFGITSFAKFHYFKELSDNIIYQNQSEEGGNFKQVLNFLYWYNLRQNLLSVNFGKILSHLWWKTIKIFVDPKNYFEVLKEYRQSQF